MCVVILRSPAGAHSGVSGVRPDASDGPADRPWRAPEWLRYVLRACSSGGGCSGWPSG